MSWQRPRKSAASVHFFATSAGFGGMERLMVSLAQQYAERGIETSIRFAPAPEIETVVQWCRQFGVRACAEPAD